MSRPAAAPDPSAAPARAPVACGALGAYDWRRVARIGEALGVPMRQVHEDDASILLLDREPLRWSGERQRGLGWIEGEIWRGNASSWGAAARLGACGLVVEGRRRYLHSSVNGIAPIYWIEDGGATYFASRIEPLVLSAPSRLSVDWDAWASILTLRYPLGERTPFAEVRRLGPFATLRRRLGRARSSSHRWPWAEIEPERDLDSGMDATADALRQALEPVEGDVLCPLSGGLDSRLLLSVLAESKRTSPAALTVSDDEGGRFEEDLAVPVAQRLGVAHECVPASAESYPSEWDERALRVEFQFVDHAWLMPLARRIAGSTAPVPDGFALDVFLVKGARFHSPAVLDAPSGAGSNRALFDSLRQYGQAQRALEPRFERPLVDRSRDQFLSAVRPLKGHPSQPILALYASRTVRGISTYPTGLLGREAPILTPGASDAFVSASLSMSVSAKRNGRMQTALFERLAPQLVGMPATGSVARAPRHLPRRWCSEPAVEAHRRRLEGGPLSRYLAPEMKAWLGDSGRGELSPDLRLGMEAVSLFHAWCDRYRDRLRDVDPADLLG